ncbi:MAG: VWA domain-containing protein [Planctomycetes bacterium]|nr:VWA domain-containing protein [Planctomycetota bacterium]
MPPSLRKPAVWLSVFAAALFALAAADVRSPGGIRARVICIDRSASVARRVGWTPLEALHMGAAGLRAGDSFCCIEFAGRARIARDWTPFRGGAIDDLSRSFAPDADLETFESDFAQVARLAATRVTDATRSEIVFVSDGRATRGGLPLAFRGFRVEAPGEPAPNAALLRIEAPRSAAPGAHAIVRARVARTPDFNINEIEWKISGAPGDAPTTSRTPLVSDGRDAAAATITITMPPDRGLAIGARVLSNDAFPEDDAAAWSIANITKMRVAIFGIAPEWFARLRAMRPLEIVDGRDAVERGELQRDAVDAVILADVDRDSLGAIRWVIEDYADRGGGILFAGARRAFVTSSFEGTRLDRALPLHADRGDGRPDETFILIDASGSMAGEKFRSAREGAIALSGVASRKGRVRAAYFQQKMFAPFDVTDPGSRALWDAVEPRGGTEEVAAIRGAAERFAKSKDTKNKIYFISDGLEKGGNAPIEDARACGENLKQSGIEILAFAVGADADLAFLRALTLDDQNGRALRVDNIRDLPEKLQNEWARDGMLPGGPVVADASGRAPVLFHRPPPVKGAARVRADPDASVAAALATGEPVFAFTKNGRVAAFATLPGGELAPEYVTSDELWLSVLQTIAKPAPRARAWIEGPIIYVEDRDCGGDGARRILQNEIVTTLIRGADCIFSGPSAGLAGGNAALKSSTGGDVGIVSIEAGAPREALPDLALPPFSGLDSLEPAAAGRSWQWPCCVVGIVALVLAALAGGRSRG